MNNKVNELMGNSFENLRKLVDVNTIIGEQITTPDGTIIIPVSKVSFGYGLGGSDWPTEKKDSFGGGTGGGVSIQPIAFLVVKDGAVQLLQLASPNNSAERAINMVPDVMDKITGIIATKKEQKQNPQA